jgi:hypothetical protein
VQQVRNGFFPGRNVVVTDNRLLAGVVRGLVGTGFHFGITGITGVAASDDDFLRFFKFLIVVRRTIALARTAGALFVAAAIVPPAAEIARRSLGGEIAEGGAGDRAGGRLDVLRGVDFRSGGVIPVGLGNCCRRWPAIGRFSLRSAPALSPPASPPPLPREVSFAAHWLLFTRPAPLAAARIAVPRAGSRGSWLRRLRGNRDIFTSDALRLSFRGR